MLHFEMVYQLMEAFLYESCGKWTSLYNGNQVSIIVIDGHSVCVHGEHENFLIEKVIFGGMAI